MGGTGDAAAADASRDDGGGGDTDGNSNNPTDGGNAGPDASTSPDAAPAPRDITFFVVADTHPDPPQSNDLRANARANRSLASRSSSGGTSLSRMRASSPNVSFSDGSVTPLLTGAPATNGPPSRRNENSVRAP